MKGITIMPSIYYTYYPTDSLSISDTAQREHLLGRALLARGLSELYHISISCADLDRALTYDRNRKPYFTQYPHIHFNITHCSGLVACAFHKDSIGIDAEFPSYFPEILISKALSEQEKCFLQSKGDKTTEKQELFYRLWTLKEAYVKKSGIGVDTNLKDFSFSFVEDKKTITATCSDSSVTCYQTKLSLGHILSACYENTADSTALVFCSLLPEQQK